ncbi:hypothetical protein C8A00DRAFT_37726 [Chaetomidium leptoderma]|uniref:Cyanovirin-N domain-containing protein n=1 Tax=Chaetomidium leptoderma TaxID=669021 RepID=A0AAN6VE60_9PEZI|nr:hypothetical protein C8A00DRAFT_37726 [Chaetomidium leptoderma]
MKLIVIFTSLLGVGAALKSAGLEARAERPDKRAPRLRVVGVEMRAPAINLAEYSTSTSKPTEKRSKSALTKMPGLQQRRESSEAAQSLKLRGEAQASDFFECTNPNPSPRTADCKVIVNQVLSTDDEIIIAANSCLVYSYRTCQAFFCSLCRTLDTSTQFIGSQLDTVDALCVENGQAGTIVGEDAPQWDAGFTYAGKGLPTFDVC